MSNDRSMTKAEALRHLKAVRAQRDDAVRERKAAEEARDRLLAERDDARRERDAARNEVKRTKTALAKLAEAVATLTGAGAEDTRRALEGSGLSALFPFPYGRR